MIEKKQEGCKGLSTFLKHYAAPMVEKARTEQQGKCYICGKRVVLVVDHDHRGNCNFRGLLCRTCNAGLGMLDDSIDNLLKAVEYLNTADDRIKRWREVL